MKLIGAVTTEGGLRIRSELDENRHETGRKSPTSNSQRVADPSEPKP